MRDGGNVSQGPGDALQHGGGGWKWVQAYTFMAGELGGVHGGSSSPVLCPEAEVGLGKVVSKVRQGRIFLAKDHACQTEQLGADTDFRDADVGTMG